jgi:NDP-sugar pyrophosphorylase family protein
MRAMILAAGLGTRLRPLTNRIPKPLVPVAGRPVIEYALLLLRSAGIRDIIVNLHHLGEQVRDRLGDGSRYGVRIRYSVEETILDTGGGIKKAEPLLRDGPFIVLNGDTITEAPLGELIARHGAGGAMATMLLRTAPDADRYGLIHVDDADRVRSFLGQPPVPPGMPWRPYMFAGLHVLDPRIFDLMPAGRPFGITRETYPLLIERGDVVRGLPFDGPWLTVDTPEALARAEADLASGRTVLSYLP